METEVKIKSKLLGDIVNFITRYVFLPNDATALILALFIVHTWTKDSAYATPYIYLHSPERQSGKTKALEVLSMLLKNPMMAASLTDAVMFRAIEYFDPTLIIDEVDTIFNGAKNESMRAVLNSGYLRSGHVWRVVKGEPERFRTFGPKLLAGINNGALPDTIRDRAIQIRMRRKPKEVSIEPFYMRDVKISPERESILNRLEVWSERHGERLSNSRPDPIEDISDRQWEITEPLVAIAEILGCEEEARKAIMELFTITHEQEGVPEEQQLLILIAAAFKDHGLNKIATRDLIERLGKDWNGKTLSNKLSCYGIQPKLIRIGNDVARGYTLEDFKPIFESYL